MIRKVECGWGRWLWLPQLAGSPSGSSEECPQGWKLPQDTHILTRVSEAPLAGGTEPSPEGWQRAGSIRVGWGRSSPHQCAKNHLEEPAASLPPNPCPSLPHQALWEENPVKFKKIFRECNGKYWQQEEAAGEYLKWKF